MESVPGILGTWRSTPISCTYGTQYGATCMEGQYWTSTQHGDSPAEHALVYNFSSIYDDLYARTGDKLWRQPIRCARHLTQ
ncbi:MAG: hypothetical protein P1U61_07160 [Legionellaceae bacterium]|nr:hypothetical protein [Legionellaceae bacterium]